MRTAILASVLLMALAPLTSVGQGRLLHGVVRDADTNVPVAGAHVLVQGTSMGVETDATGRFQLAVEGSNVVVLKLTYVGYADLLHTVTKEELVPDASIVLLMKRTTFELPLVDIQAPLPEVVFQRADLHVGAYHANSDGLWVLVYDRVQLWHREDRAGEQGLHGARLFLLDTDFNERANIAIPDEVRAMHHDHAQRVVIEGARGAWVAEAREDGIALGQLDLETLRTAVLPWTDSIAGQLLGSNASATYPAFDHFAHNLATKEERAICSISDDRLMDLFRSQYKYMSGHDKVVAMDLELETGIDREVIAGYMTNFHKDPYFRRPYAPLFVVHDTVCVFDHYRERILRYTRDLEPVDEVSIVHQRERTWDGVLLQDAHTGEVYALFSRNSRSWVSRIDPRTGAIGHAVPLTFPYPEEVQLYDGWIHYVYRPHGSLQKRTLYREALR